MLTYIHTYMHAYIHANIHAYMHTYMHTYIGEAAENAAYLEHQGVALGVHGSASFLESLTGLDAPQCAHRVSVDALGAGEEGRARGLLPDWRVAVGERDPARGENTYMLTLRDT